MKGHDPLRGLNPEVRAMIERPVDAPPAGAARGPGASDALDPVAYMVRIAQEEGRILPRTRTGKRPPLLVTEPYPGLRQSYAIPGRALRTWLLARAVKGLGATPTEHEVDLAMLLLEGLALLERRGANAGPNKARILH